MQSLAQWKFVLGKEKAKQRGMKFCRKTGRIEPRGDKRLEFRDEATVAFHARGGHIEARRVAFGGRHPVVIRNPMEK